MPPREHDARRIPVKWRVAIYVGSLFLPFFSLALRWLNGTEAIAALTVVAAAIGPALALSYVPEGDE